MTDRTVHEECGKPDATCECLPRNLLPPLAIAEIERVLQHGAEKHSPWGWRKNTAEQDGQAAERHLFAYGVGERHEHESRLHPLAHTICRLMFILDRELTEEADSHDD